jgi:adenylate cyclase
VNFIKRFFRAMFSFDRILGYALLIGFISIYYWNPAPVEFARLKVFDYYVQWKPRPIPPKNQQPVTIIDIDEQSLETIGQWPWARNTLAKLVQNAMQMGAAVIAFDIVFAEPDGKDLSVVASGTANLSDDVRAILAKRISNDQLFANMIKRSRVVLGQAGRTSETEGIKGPPAKNSVAIRKMQKGAPDPKGFLPNFPALVRNIPIIEKAAIHKMGGHGMFNAIPDEDGIIRNVPSLFVHEGAYFPTLSVEMLRVVTGRKTVLAVINNAGMDGIKITPKLTAKTDRYGRIWPYFSKHDAGKYVSARELLDGTADPAMIKGKLLILGTSAVGLRDIRTIPTARDIPGVEVHAQLIEAIAQQQYLTRPNYADAVEMAFIFFGGLIMIVLVPWAGAKWTALVFLLTAVGAGGTSWHLFANEKLLLDASFAIGSILLIYTTLTYTGYAREEANKKKTRDAFSKYLSPDMVARVAENPDELTLGGEQRDLTLLFCDVRGFTTISEQFDAVGLTDLINKLLTPLTNVILERHGTIDKYMGDCIMAFWNAPLNDDDQEYNGCTSALAMLGEMGPLNERLRLEAEEEGRKHIPLKVGLGLNTGPCVVGNMGSDMRFDYSVLGDAVNLAARLEGQSKSYGMNVVLGPSTRNTIKDRLATIDLDFIQVKGKTEGTYIYGLMGDEKVLADPGFLEVRDLIEKFMEAYRTQQWDDASFMLGVIRTKGNDDNKPWVLDANLDVLCDLYEERILEYKKSPPAEDWDGVFIATTK